jgi:hypothetical protein
VWSGEGGNETRKEEQKGKQKGRIEIGERKENIGKEKYRMERKE